LSTLDRDVDVVATVEEHDGGGDVRAAKSEEHVIHCEQEEEERGARVDRRPWLRVPQRHAHHE
jgi:hypothetical protein